MVDRVRMAELTYEEFESRVTEGPVFLPVGSTEQHGPHLPLNVDTVLATELATRAARQVGGVVAPPLPYGFNSQPDSGGGVDFPGTTSLDGGTLTRLAGDVIGDLVADGGTEIVAVNGHYENEYFLREAIQLHLEDGRGEFVVASWWDLLSEAVREEVFESVPDGFPGWATEHAGVVETALMLHFRPGLVREDRVVDDGVERPRPYAKYPPEDDQIPDSGVYYRASHATTEMGEVVAEDVIDRLVEGVEAEWGAVLGE